MHVHALKWSAVTATDAKLLQSPFWAGIKLMDHLRTPLPNALQLPRANLFITDDVSPGKTIEAGFVAEALLRRQRIDLIVIACPASVCLRWRDEIERRFELHFEVMSRTLVGRRWQQRGFAVSPWNTRTRFIISHALPGRSESRDRLLQHPDVRAPKTLLILEEAHVAAPAGLSRCAVDSKITDVIRDVASRFENRPFRSATPHNGHGRSFSSLLEIHDLRRFSRGVPVHGQKQLDAAMVRQLKEDLRKLATEQLPIRRLLGLDLTQQGESFVELELATLLSEYTEFVQPEQGPGRLVFINLQKQLLSSVKAFARPLRARHRAVALGRTKTAVQFSLLDDEYGVDAEVLDKVDETTVEAAASVLPPGDHTSEMLDHLRTLAQQSRGAADAKVRGPLDWIRKIQCAAAQVGGAAAKGPRADKKWTDRRVLIVTECGGTKRYLQQLLQAAIYGTDRAAERILTLQGAIGDEPRDEVQYAFNSPPEDDAARILIATHAARAGVNLQGRCADRFHFFDIPWRPARLEQRNGGIDRVQQDSPEVRCHYFIYAEHTEDLALKALVAQVDTHQRELRSTKSVLLDRLNDVMEDGVSAAILSKLTTAEETEDLKATAKFELESKRRDLQELRGEINEADAIVSRSNKIVMPEVPESWQRTRDLLRPPRRRLEHFWEFRKRPPQPVIFQSPPRVNSSLSHRHIQYSSVQRVPGRFITQGYGAQNFSRATVVRTWHDSLTRIIALGRLSLISKGLSVATKQNGTGKAAAKKAAKKAPTPQVELGLVGDAEKFDESRSATPSH